ncbi:MAG: S8 family serine peptidase, partial [Myxococcota bacterium]
PAATAWRTAGPAGARAAAVARARGRIELEHDALRPRLLGLGAVVVEELQLLANAFHVELPRSALARLEQLPGVRHVEPAPVFYTSLDRGLRTVRAPNAWSTAGATGLHGAGIRVGIIDTGVDYYHAAFGGTGDPSDFSGDDSSLVEPGTFPAGRVVGGFDFVGDGYNPEIGASTIAADPDPLDCEGHGTHVASIAVGNAVNDDGTVFDGSYDQTLDLSQFRVAPGVAPEADVFALKVFGCARGTSVVASALEWAADPDGNGIPDDRLDVVNLSLGSSYGGLTGSLLYGNVMDNLVGVGTVVVAAAGNDGGTFFVTGSPASVDPVLSVAASVDAGLVNIATSAGDITGVEGSLSPPLAATGTVATAASRAQPANACGGITNVGDVAGTIVVIDRGNCQFIEKLTAAETAGALGAIIVQNTTDPPFTMGGNGSVTIPSVMVSQADGQALIAALANGMLTITLADDPFVGPGAEQVASLSSRGPSLDTIAIKPEIAAPGVNVDAADVGSGTEPTDKSGTSMAAPFVAGAAALVREAQPNLSALDIKAMLMNHAEPVVGTSGARFPVSMQGTGRLDVARAVAGEITLRDAEARDLMGVSFGAHIVDETWRDERTVEVKNHGVEPRTFTVVAAPHRDLPGVTITVSPPSVTVAPDATATVTLTLEVDPTAFGTPPLDAFTPEAYDFGEGDPNPRHALVEIDGLVVLEDEDDAVRLPYYAFVRPAAQRFAEVATCSEEEVVVRTAGESAHPNPVVSAFELGVIDEATFPADEAVFDLRAVGAVTDAPTAETFEDTSLFFGVAVEGSWVTPAAGPRSAVGIIIDVDADENADYAIVAEPLGAEPPYLDLLASTTYDLSACEGGFIGSCLEGDRKRFLNIVPATTIDTVPFFNGVVVLSTFADQIGLRPGETQFRYAAVSLSVFGEQDRTDWVPFDAAAPGLDPASDAPIEGRPVFEGDASIRVRRGSSGAGRLLLLHHTNLEGQRWEALDVGLPAGVSIGVSGPDAVEADARSVSMRVEVRNEGGDEVTGLTVDLAATGGTIDGIDAPGLSCGAADCTIETIAAGASLVFDVRVAVSGGTDGGTVSLAAEAQAGGGCAVTAEASAERPSVEPEVARRSVIDIGCNCTVVGVAGENEGSSGWWMLGFLGVPWARRRRLRHAGLR